MDPQQRLLLLRTAYEALENSDYVPYATPTFNPEGMGCYVGAATNDYMLNLREGRIFFLWNVIQPSVDNKAVTRPREAPLGVQRPKSVDLASNPQIFGGQIRNFR